MILLHEMGHFVEVKRRGLPAEMPVFLPGLGAYVKWQGLGVSTEARALISLAGPAAGLLAAFIAAALFWQTGNPLWAALAHTGAWLNLLNLIPVWMLDGNGAVQPLDKMGRISLLVFSGLLFWWSGEMVLLLLAAGFAWQLYRKADSSRRLGHCATVFCGTPRRSRMVAPRHANREDVGRDHCQHKADLPQTGLRPRRDSPGSVEGLPIPLKPGESLSAPDFGS